jgi:hypothetical protein
LNKLTIHLLELAADTEFKAFIYDIIRGLQVNPDQQQPRTSLTFLLLPLARVSHCSQAVHVLVHL